MDDTKIETAECISRSCGLQLATENRTSKYNR